MFRRCIALSLAAAVVIAAAPSDPIAMIKVRHKGMEEIGAAFKKLKAESAASAPNVGVVRANAAIVQRHATAQLNWFPKGSGPDAGHKTDAKKEIWTDPANFRQAQLKFQTEANKLNAVAVKGDMAALPAQFRATGGTCKGCHDKYREEDD